MPKCHGKSIAGKRCQLNVVTGQFCHHHIDQEFEMEKDILLKNDSHESRKRDISPPVLPRAKKAELFIDGNDESCQKAQELLEQNEYEVTIYDLEDDPSYTQILRSKGGNPKKLPQTFVSGHHLDGNAQLANFLQNPFSLSKHNHLQTLPKSEPRIKA